MIMAIRNDHDDYGWAMGRNRRARPDQSRGLHDYGEPAPDFKDTVVELTTTLAGIVGVFLLVMAIVKVFG
jgi:hypothetical protein